MHGPHRWSASRLKAPRDGSLRARSLQATTSRAIWPNPMAQALFPPSSDCTAAPGCMMRPSKGWPTNSSAGAMSSCYATRRGMDDACTSTAFASFVKRRPDPYGALAFLARQSFVDPQRVAVVGFSAGARVALFVAESHSFDEFVPEGNLRFRAAAAFYPPCGQAVGRPGIPTLIFIGALDDWTPAAACSRRIAGWGNDGAPIELIVYPGGYHGFYYAYLQPGRTMFDHWLEYNGEAADNADHRLRQFLDRHLKADSGNRNSLRFLVQNTP